MDGLGVLRRRPEAPDPGRPAVVLVHGAMDRAASFGRTMRRLGDLDVSAYDRRGYATSLDAGTAVTLDEQAADLMAIAEWTGAPTVVVVGHSFGGTVAMRAAESDPRRLVGLGAFESPVPTLATYRSDGADLALDAAEAGGPPAAAEAFYRLVVGDATWDRLRAADRDARLAEGDQLVAELLDLRRPSGTPDLSRVQLPVVVGAGGASHEGWKASAVELAERLPHAFYVEIAGAGHGAHLSHPDEFARYVQRCVDAAT
ncbi:alpha/beta fold hydrolase [Dermatobacter hominis]|uniref:alpha/beta fold hydrolase n=1 Tax=Dermatobacter hominis TaxID=2884263 RepID=UPI001D128BD8|nr:alpha/beta hydrolase [Dermatobacter hominis]UDY36437.1 alpha/beta hydrolase [Dermatobacter hominis]